MNRFDETPLPDIAALVERYREGVSIGTLLKALGVPMARRTAQRQLNRAVAAGRIRRQGIRAAARYLPLKAARGLAAPANRFVGAPAEMVIPLSPEGREIQNYVRLRRELRRPVSYNLGFVEAYRPNQSFYLPTALREQFHAVARTPADKAPAGTFARDILERLLIDLSWASSHLEGNTYDRLDTERLLKFGEEAAGRDAIETRMILNHKAAIEYIVRHAGEIAVDRWTIQELHALLADGLLADRQSIGRPRRRVVDIGGSVYRPSGVPQLIEKAFDTVMAIAGAIEDPFEQSFFLMVQLPYLQPFLDVNKRVSRLAANIPLIKHNLSPLSFIDVPRDAYVEGLLGVYELNRIELLRDVFDWAYMRSCQEYLAVHAQLVAPDRFRSRHLAALAETIAAIVRAGEPANPATIRRRMPASLADAERERFLALVLEEFEYLHTYNALVFGIGREEFNRWKSTQGN